MNRYLNHIKHSWKALCLVASVFQLLTVILLVASLIKGTLDFGLLLQVIGVGLIAGVIVSLLFASSEMKSQDKIKRKLSSIELRKVGTGKFKLIDQYKNGWGRSIMIVGSFQKKNVHIQYKHEKGKKGRDLLLIFLVELEREFYEEAAAMKLDDTTTPDAITKVLHDAINVSNNPKFGEIYWELKRRKDRNRSRK